MVRDNAPLTLAIVEMLMDNAYLVIPRLEVISII